MSFKMLYFSDRLIIHPNRISYYNKIAEPVERCKKSVQRVSVFGAAMRQIVRKYVRRSHSEEGRRTHA